MRKELKTQDRTPRQYTPRVFISAVNNRFLKAQLFFLFNYLTIALFYSFFILCDRSININIYKIYRIRVMMQVFKREFHTHIHLDYIII